MNRALHLIDLENLAGGPRMDTIAILLAASAFAREATVAPGDLVWVAADVSVWRRTAFDLPRAWRFHPGFGRDGADRRLLADADPRWICRRFDRLVVGSGDHAFVPLATTCRRAGLRVDAVSRHGAMSRVLARSVHQVTYVDSPDAVIDLRSAGLVGAAGD